VRSNNNFQQNCHNKREVARIVQERLYLPN
jgi:hypothetical protein